MLFWLPKKNLLGSVSKINSNLRKKIINLTVAKLEIVSLTPLVTSFFPSSPCLWTRACMLCILLGIKLFKFHWGFIGEVVMLMYTTRVLRMFKYGMTLNFPLSPSSPRNLGHVHETSLSRNYIPNLCFFSLYFKQQQRLYNKRYLKSWY